MNIKEKKMNRNNNFVVAVMFGAIVFVFSNLAAFGQADPPDPVRTEFSRYGMHFIENGRTVRVNVAHPRVIQPSSTNSASQRPNPRDCVGCILVRIDFDVYEAAGAGAISLRFARRVSREIELAPGEAASFDFAASRNGDFVVPSIYARPEESGVENPTTRLLSTVSIRYGGSTVLLLPAVLQGFDPQPEPPAATEQ
jgi:hypothetical protein